MSNLIEDSENKKRLKKLVDAGCQVIMPQSGIPEILIPNTGLGKGILGLLDYFESRGVKIGVKTGRRNNAYRRNK